MIGQILPLTEENLDLIWTRCDTEPRITAIIVLKDYSEQFHIAIFNAMKAEPSFHDKMISHCYDPRRLLPEKILSFTNDSAIFCRSYNSLLWYRDKFDYILYIEDDFIDDEINEILPWYLKDDFSFGNPEVLF